MSAAAARAPSERLAQPSPTLIAVPAMRPLAWTALFLGIAIWGYDPAKGFVASTGKGE